MSDIMRNPRPTWALWVAIVVPPVVAATVAVVMTYRDITTMVSAVTAALPQITIIPSDDLPAAAAPAALSLLSTAVGVQLLGRSLQQPVAGLTLVTTWLLASGALLASGREVLVVAAIWCGTALTGAMLAPVALGAAWFAGHTPAGQLTRTWRVVILVALALIGVDGVFYGEVTIPMLFTLGVVVAGSRHRLADRIEAMLRA